MSNLTTRIDKAATLAREQERARHDRALTGVSELIAPIWAHTDYESWVEKLSREVSDYLPVFLCNAITHLRAQLPEAVRIGFAVGSRKDIALADVSDLELKAVAVAYLSRDDYATGNLAALFYAVDPQAGDDAANNLRVALTETEREILGVLLSPDVAPTWEKEMRLYEAAYRLLPLVEAARDAMRARGLAYDGNPLTLVSLSNKRDMQAAPVGE